MKALILAAGYATRLYPLTLDQPKPLLKVGSKTITERILEKIERAGNVDKIYIVTNERFSSHFTRWARKSKYKKTLEVINDHTLTNETRLGAIGDIDLVIKEARIADDLLVVGGDNLFDFDLGDFVKFAQAKGKTAVALLDVEDIELAKKYGIVGLDSKDRVVDFQEKPEDPKSTLAAICVYYFPKDMLNLVDKYLNTGENKDAPGHYIGWLATNDTVYGYKIEGQWFDIGDKESLSQADEIYKKMEGER
ncbi:MAG: nucleotidyltransferase family protein [Candidatus Omnitrophica bacterium]|nr:nucleotidyltransferase family protein [Candidatus Omnitrophota bacterium]